MTPSSQCKRGYFNPHDSGPHMQTAVCSLPTDLNATPRAVHRCSQHVVAASTLRTADRKALPGLTYRLHTVQNLSNTKAPSHVSSALPICPALLAVDMAHPGPAWGSMSLTETSLVFWLLVDVAIQWVSLRSASCLSL